MSTSPVTKETQKRTRAIVDELGEVRAAEKLGVSRGSLLRIISGRPVHAGTQALLNLRLAEVAQ